MFSSATMSVNPDIAEAHALRGWWVLLDGHAKRARY